MNSLARRDSATAERIPDYQSIIGFRNVLVHGYDVVEDPFVWDTIQKRLPKLLQNVEKLLEEPTEYED